MARRTENGGNLHNFIQWVFKLFAFLTVPVPVIQKIIYVIEILCIKSRCYVFCSSSPYIPFRWQNHCYYHIVINTDDIQPRSMLINAFILPQRHVSYDLRKNTFHACLGLNEESVFIYCPSVLEEIRLQREVPRPWQEGRILQKYLKFNLSFACSISNR